MQEELLRSVVRTGALKVVILLVFNRYISGHIGASGGHGILCFREGTASIDHFYKVSKRILADQFAGSAVIPILVICTVVLQLRRRELIILKVSDAIVGAGSGLSDRSAPGLCDFEMLLIRDIDLCFEIFDQLFDNSKVEIPALVSVVLRAVVIRVDPDIAAHLDQRRCDRHFHLVAAQRFISLRFVRCTGR